MRTRFALAALLTTAVLVLALALGSTGASAAKPHCTIKGTAHADHLVGTPHRDVICAAGGDDWVDGRGGNDVLIGGPGNDRLIGGPGNDDLRGGAGDDVLSGGAGRNICRDAAGTVRTGCAHRVPGDPMPHPVLPTHRATTTPCCSVQPDTQPPDTAWIWLSDRYVDTSTGDKTIGVSVEAWDESGLGSATIQIEGPSGLWRTVSLRVVSAMRAEATFPVPATTPSGDYRVTALTIADTKGNSRSRTAGELEPGPWVEFEVFHGPDTEGPQLTGFTLSAEAIDTSSAPGAITTTIEAEDPLSGVQSAYAAIQLPGWEPGGLILTGSCSSEEPPQLGTRHAGAWVNEYSLVQHAIPGTYVVSGVYLCDLAGNWTHWTKEELEELGYATEFVETGPGDTTVPEILDFWFEPATLHAAAGDASVDFYVHVRDDDTGLGGPRLNAYANVWVDFDHPGPSTEASYTGMAPELISGTSQDGIWKSVTTLPPDAPLGAYHVSELAASDRAGNVAYVKEPELATTSWPLTFENLP